MAADLVFDLRHSVGILAASTIIGAYCWEDKARPKFIEAKTMGRRPASLSQADIARAVKVAAQAGMTVEIVPSQGIIRLIPGTGVLPESRKTDEDQVIPL